MKRSRSIHGTGAGAITPELPPLPITVPDRKVESIIFGLYLQAKADAEMWKNRADAADQRKRKLADTFQKYRLRPQLKAMVKHLIEEGKKQ